MKKTLLSVVIILLFCCQIFAQKSLIFLNTKTNETIEVSVGQTLSIKSGFLSNLSIKTPRSNFSNALSQNSV
jgi:hypothetical protein